MNNMPTTILHPKNFKDSVWSMECPYCQRLIGFDGIFHWNWVLDAIGYSSAVTRIHPMDFDGVIERKFNYLIFETKDAGVPVSQAQKWTLERLIHANSITIMYVEGKTMPESFKATVYFRDGRNIFEEGQGHKHAIDYVKRWFSWANKN
jgi:hypothetical protein